MIAEATLIILAKPAIDNFLKDVVSPKIKSFAEKCEIEYNKLLFPIVEHFEEYLYRTMNR